MCIIHDLATDIKNDDRARLAELGAMPMIVSPADFGKLIVNETEKWGKVVKFAGIKPE